MSLTLLFVCQSADVGNEPMFDVVVVGSANIDLVATAAHLPIPGETLMATTYSEHAGGKGLNQAIACARMGARTAFIGCVGNDAAGIMLGELLRQENIDTSQLITVDAPTGRAFITVDDEGENTIVVVSGANSHVRDIAFVVPSTRVVLAQLEIPFDAVKSAFIQARSLGATTVLNPAPAAILPAEFLMLCDIAIPNENECVALGGATALHTAGVPIVITTRGNQGAEISSAEGILPVAAHAVSAIDTVGAGDAFAGAFCAGIADGLPVAQAVARAVVAGAIATTVRGAVPSLPSRKTVQGFLAL